MGGELGAKLLARLLEAGADRALGDAQRGRDLTVVIAVVVAEHDRGRELRGELPEGREEVRAGGLVGGVG